MQIEQISASRVNTFIECSFKYFLNYEVYICDKCGEYTFLSELRNIGRNDKICLNPDCNEQKLRKISLPTSWAALNGTICHKVLELYAQAKKEGKKDWRLNWKDNLLKFYLEDYAEFDVDSPPLFYSNADINPCHKKCYIYNKFKKNMCVKFSKKESFCFENIVSDTINLLDKTINKYDKRFENECIETEKEFNIYLNDKVKLTGKIDTIFEIDENTIEIVDYKTGNKTKKYDELLKDLQAKFYFLAASHLFPEKKYCLLTFDYLKKYPVTLTFDKFQNKFIEQKIIKYWKAIEDTTILRRLPLNRDGSIFWYCQRMCSRKLCDEIWKIYYERYGLEGF